MKEIDKLDLDGAAGDKAGKSETRAEVVDGIRSLAEAQPYGVLCTQTEGQPYGSLVALAFTDDLTRVVFSTPKATRKYNNLTECDRVAVVVNNLDKFPDELMKVSAFTLTGKAHETASEEERKKWSSLLAKRHPELRSFIESPTTAVFSVKILRFFFVSTFQKVAQWTPPGDMD